MRWLTNMQTPIDITDYGFLLQLQDYKLGPPKEAVEQKEPTPLKQLLENGIVGVYTSAEAIDRIRSNLKSKDLANFGISHAVEAVKKTL